MRPDELLCKKAKSISLEVTTYCPLKCVYCERKIKKRTMSYEGFLQIKKKLEEDEKIERVIFCGIGESFLHNEIYRMVEELKNYKITVITSGTVLIDFEQLCKYGNVDIIIFSIDSPSAETIKDICGENYDYDILVKNMERMNKCVKEAFKKHKIITSVVNCTINDKNKNRLAQMIAFAYQHKFSSVHYSLPWGKYELVKENYRPLTEEFKKAKIEAVKYGIYMENPWNSFCCISHDHVMPYIDVEGNYYTCSLELYLKEPTGNIFYNSILELQTGKNVRKLKEGQLCNDCFLYQFHRLEEKEGDGKERVY